MKNETKFFLFASCLSVLVNAPTLYKMSVDKNNDKEHICSDIDLVVHRGLSYDCLDNSLSATIKGNAMECVNSIEIDVRFTSDNHIVLAHDDLLFTNAGFLSVKNMSYGQLKNLVIYSDQKEDILSVIPGFFETKSLDKNMKIYNTLKGDKIYTLEEVLKLNISKELLVDIKFSHDEEQMMDKLNTYFEDYKGSVCFQSFDNELLKEMRKKYPKYNYQQLVKDMDDIDLSYDRYAICYTSIDYDLLKKLIDNEKDISIWTINDERSYNKIVDNLDYYSDKVSYITDYPDVLCIEKGKQLIK